MRLLQDKFFKEFLGIFFLEGAVDIDIHKKLKNKITTKFKEKRRLSTVSLNIGLGKERLSKFPSIIN